MKQYVYNSSFVSLVVLHTMCIQARKSLTTSTNYLEVSLDVYNGY